MMIGMVTLTDVEIDASEGDVRLRSGDSVRLGREDSLRLVMDKFDMAAVDVGTETKEVV